jgi:hypothetical protein
MYKKIVNLPNLTLLVALSLSAVAEYYSIIGLTTIFAGAFYPVIIMGATLGVAKLTTILWLRTYWQKASWILKAYLIPAVISLAFLTSMGIFGYLSKAHMDQGVTSGDVQGKVAIYDEKIKTSKDNIDANRKALKQLDEAVDQVMGRSTSEQGADKAVQIRKSQANDRKRLLAEIQAEQKTIGKLSEERAPLASELRKVEAEVGPIKYIAALIYGDNADANMLEAAVRWVIILLVIVFDPLAIALVLAGNQSKEWNDEEPQYEKDDGPLTPQEIDQLKKSVEAFLPQGKTINKTELFPDIDEANRLIDEIEREVPETILPEASTEVDYSTHIYLSQGFGAPMPEEFRVGPLVHIPEPTKVDFVQGNYLIGDPVINYSIVQPEKYIDPAPMPELSGETVDRPGDYILQEDNTHFVVPEIKKAYVEEEDGYVIYDGLHMSKDALKGMHPELFALKADTRRPIRTNFGISFPGEADKGDIFVRIDMLPNRVYKFDGYGKWIEVNKEITDTYLHNQKYLQYLVNMIDKGQYDVELLSENEKAEIEEYLRNQNS